ncbi:helix-turn-helix domain-containing protein [Streptomyces griseiscabiei]|uniref:Helix-turn-helix domain-containing protein n=1 Tax=Streptomyces griseiscabiei TaxID=2993540 RepID=A0ABU4LGA7_9ACTN|nr:helix-turn-helix domain-containing protein [Streptomyces griseiscabiei]MBZ3907175.1 helix-turn-helix domain-containing protein [Streptomyces griseiscabiei]MDX2914325.1 helix-turn-helix domain-containing protein [Streptomyces griseiscabiei]
MDDYSRGALPPVQRFATELRRLRITAGEPQLKTIAARAQCSQATVSEALNGRRLPSETVTRRLVLALDGDWTRWQDLWRLVRTELDDLKHRTDETPPRTLRADMVHYPDASAFYKAAAEAVRAARHELRLTYVRLHPPGHWLASEAAVYFETVVRWAKEHAGGSASVRRIIGVPERDGVPPPAFLAWLREHQAEVRDVYSYEARVIPWHHTCAWHNTGLLDDSITFLSFAGVGRQQLTGLSVESPLFLSHYATVFDQAWGALRPLDEYMAGHTHT